MRRFLSVTGLLFFHTLLFASSADTTVIEITGESLPGVYYSIQTFPTPTKLVFKNLVSVSGNVYFYQNVNLVEVDFPKLQSCEGNFYFYQNTSLLGIIAPNLTSLQDQLYITGNTSLTQLQVCNLKQIAPSPDNSSPYNISCEISGNTPAVDTWPFCFSQGGPLNFKLSNNIIKENSPAYFFIGRLSCSGAGNTKLSYYLVEDIFDGRFFKVQGDSLLSTKMFTYATQNTYTFNLVVVNQLAEKSTMVATIHVTEDLTTPDTVVVEITDTTLPIVAYHQGFTQPTRLVFKNLESVAGNIDFTGNVNLVEVNLPKLKSCEGHFGVNQNIGLQKFIAPQLNSVGDYLDISGNKSLADLQICNLRHIAPIKDALEPYQVFYRISDNTDSVDYKTPLCFTRTSPNVSLSKDSIGENLPANSLVSKLSSISLHGDKMRYYLTDDVDTDNRQFAIRNDSLLSLIPFDYETKNSYHVAILAVNEMAEKAVADLTIKVTDMVFEDTATLVITDTVLPSVSFSPRTFSKPTRVIYKNLTRVTGPVNFDQVINLIEVSFPLLEKVEGIVYLHANASLLSVNAPALKTIYDYLYVEANTALTELKICNLSNILPSDTMVIPYYYIANNNSLDNGSACIKKTNVIYVPVTSIIEKPVPNTFIGYFISDAPTTDSMRYYFVDDDGNETSHPDFVIRGDSVFLTKALAYYTGSATAIDINAIRSAKVQQKSLGLSSLLAEKISLTVQTNLSNSVRYSTQWIGLSDTPANSAWENPANWSSNTVPDANTDVTLTNGKIIIGTNAICRSLTIYTGANVTVKTPFRLTITH